MSKYLRVMVVGGGGREHALAWRLSRSATVEHVYVVPGNAGISSMDSCVSAIGGIGVDDFPSLVTLAQSLKIGLVVVGPDSAIVGGIREYFDEARIPCFAPSKKAAEIEGSKVFAKNFMRQFNIPTAEYETFDDFDKAAAYFAEVSHEIVIKADGLAAGKGVVLPKTKGEALSVLREILVERRFGSAGNSVVIEEYLDGQEISVSTLSDGQDIITLSVGQDHKRIMDNDEGPNTGGMGVYAPVPCASPDVMDVIERTILQPTFEAFRQQGNPFVGLLFTGIMLTSRGPKVLKYNARFGDPETQSVLPLIDSQVDLASVMLACVQGRLNTIEVPLSQKYACNVVIVAEGYPGDFRKGDVVSFEPVPPECIVFYAGTKLIDGRVTTSGGRVFSVVGTGDTLHEAVDRAYLGVQSIKFEGMFFRKDIARRALA